MILMINFVKFNKSRHKYETYKQNKIIKIKKANQSCMITNMNLVYTDQE